MVKVKKTYRLNQSTVEQIQTLKDYLDSKGYELSDAGVIQMAISSYMDTVAIEIDPNAVYQNQKEEYE